MDTVTRSLWRALLAICLVGGTGEAAAQGFAADYSFTRFAAPVSDVPWRIAPAVRLADSNAAAGLSLQAGKNWFGQFGLAQGPVSPLAHAGTNDMLNLAGGYRWGDGQSLSLQVSRGRGPGQRLGLAVNYDWPHTFIRFSWDQGLNVNPQDSLRFSAGVRF